MKMTDAEYQALLRCDLYAFTQRAFSELESGSSFVHAQYIELVAATLTRVANGQCRRLIINLPPRHLKSMTISIAFVAWYLGHKPAMRVICASYGQELAEKLARDTRSLMRADWYQECFGEVLSPSRQAVNDFDTILGGGRLATSVGGALTGRGADLIIIDDPLKPAEALSEISRKAVKSWYDNTLLSRLNSKTLGSIIITMQRLHQDDLVGHVLEREGWEVLALPAIAEVEECYPFESVLGPRTFSRHPGELLQPMRESQQVLDELRKSMSEYNFVSQYQQSPMPQDGNIIKHEMLRFCTAEDWPERFDSVVQSWDTAIKVGLTNDFSVCTTWGSLNKCFYLIDVYRQRLEYPDLKKAVRTLKERHSPGRVVIEDKASGSQLIQDLEREGLYGLHPYLPPEQVDKATRLMLQLDPFTERRVILPKYAPWGDEYIKELLSFPGGKFDDQVDSTSQALDYLKRDDSLALWAKLAG